MAENVERKLDHTLNFVSQQARAIEIAVVSLGIPFEVCVCAAVQKAIRIHEADPRQLDLFTVNRESQKES